MANRVEGQIWIGRDEPNVFKYFARGKEYWGVSAATYVSGADIKKGMVLAANFNPTGLSESVIPAEWPRDADRLVGVALHDASLNFTIRVLNYGYLKLTQAELQATFVTRSDINAGPSLTAGNYYTTFGNTATTDGGAGNNWVDTADQKGRAANVYWFSGRTLKTSGGYTYVDPSAYPGKLTTSTPSGYRAFDTDTAPWGDDSLNIAYKNLPVIGNVVSYTYDGSKNLTEAILHVNFTKFQKTIRFEYPAKELKAYAQTGAQIITLRHGLFANYGKPCVTVNMKGYTDMDPDSAAAGETYQVFPGHDSFMTTPDRRTEVEIASNSVFNYKIVGDVTFCI